MTWGTIGSRGTLGTDLDYGSLLGARQDPRLLMAQKLMDLDKQPTTNASQSSFWANLLNQGLRGGLSGYLYNNVEADREKEATKQKDEAEKFRTQIEAGPPTSAPVKDGSGGAAPAQPAAGGDPGAGSSDAGASIQDRLRQRESSGNYGVMNKQRYAGAYQFGSDLLAANNLYQRTEQGEPANTWGGTFSIPGHPNVKTLADFRNTPEAQDAAYRIAMANNDKQLREMGVYDRAAKLGGVTRDGLLAGAWLGGVHGVANWVDSGGQSNPGDANGTRIGDYVRMGSGQGVGPTKAARAPAMARGQPEPSFGRGRQADAGPGSNLEALLAGVNAAKPRGVQLAENLVGGTTATDAPTPILPPNPMANADPGTLANFNGLPTPPAVGLPAPDAASVPPIAAAVPPRAEPAPAPPPGLVPPSPAPPLPGADDPYVNQADVPPPPAPTPVLGNTAAPLQAQMPPNPMAGADPASLASFNDVQAPPAATVPPPDAATVPGPAAATVPPGPVPARPPIPPQRGPSGPQLAAPLVSGGGDNATEALNTASLAAARRGENFVPGAPGAGPAGPQLAAPLMSWAGNLTDAGAPLLTPAGGPTGPQLAAPLLPPGTPGARPNGSFGQASQQGGPVPLVTPASGPGPIEPIGRGDATGATTDTAAAGGPNKGAVAPAQASSPAAIADAQAKADWYLSMARQAAGSSNPRIRANAGVLEAQGMQFQRTADRLTTASDRLTASREARETAAANRNLPIHDLTLADGKVHSVQVMPDGSQRDLGLSGNQHAKTERNPQHVTVKVDGKNYVHTWNPDTGKYENTGLLAEKQEGEGGPYSGKSVPAEDRNIIDRLHESIANNTASEADKRRYSLAYNSLKNGTPSEIPDPANPSRTIRVPGQPADLTGYAPPPYHDTTAMPGKPASEAERVAGGFARRMDLTNREIDRIGTQSFGDVTAGRVPVVGNYLTSNQGQQFQTAAKAWVLAKLRKESGAAFGEGEWEREFSTYFPQPGDTPDRVALKKRLRDLETQNMQRDAGNAYTPSEPAATGGGSGKPNMPSEGAVIKQGDKTYKIINGQAVEQ